MTDHRTSPVPGDRGSPTRRWTRSSSTSAPAPSPPRALARDA